jgi:hypothetical protein
MVEGEYMSYIYKYNKEHSTLEQYKDGMLRACMPMPKSDLNKLAQLNIKENILRSIDLEVKSDV